MKLGEAQKASKMASLSRISPIRIEQRPQQVSIPNYSSVSSLEEGYGSADDMSISPDTSYRSSADADKSFDPEEDFRKELIKFDNIIEKIENLRFARNNNDEEDDEDEDEDANENVGRTRRVASKSVDNVEYRNTREPRVTNRCADNEDINNNDTTTDENEDCRQLNIRDESRDYNGDDNDDNDDDDDDDDDDDNDDDNEGHRRSSEDRSSTDENSETSEQEQPQEHEDSDDSDLIERGPIKPDYQPLRGHPYSMVSCLSRAIDGADGADVAHAVDYDKTAEQILRNKDYSEKLNPCLDQLSNSSCRNQLSIGAIVGGLTMDSGWPGENGDGIFRSEDPGGDTAALPSIVVNDPAEESLMDILSRGGFQAAVFSDAGSHSIPSPGAKTWSDSPASSYNYVVSRSNSRASSRAQSPGSGTNLESPQMHVNVIGSPLSSPQVPSTYRVQALSSSSSSNQSYGDASSPSSSNYRSPVSYQIEEQLGISFESLNKTYDSSGTIVNSNDTIDCALLQLVEQVIEEDKCRKTGFKEPQVASNVPIFKLDCFTRADALPEGRSEKLESFFNVDTVGGTNEPSGLMSVYRNTSGCTYINHSMDHPLPTGRAESPGRRYYEPRTTNVDLPLHKNLHHDINVNGGGSTRASEQQHLHSSRERYALMNAVQEEKRYDQPSSSTFVPSDYQIPTMVSSFVSSRPQRKSDRGIVPWPSLNLPSVRASERLKEGSHPKEVERAMSNLLKKSIEELASADEDGDTALMCLVGNPDELAKKKAYLAPLVERLGNLPNALSMVNNRGEDALYLAAMNCPETPYVTGYLAAAMLQKRIDIDQRLYHIRGDTLIHSVAARGDSHGEVLAELLALKTLQGSPVFDLSKCNYDGRTALHVAVESHDPAGRGIKSLATTRLLLENGANPKVKESKCGDTALHMAVSLSCDPALVKVLVRSSTPDVVNEGNYICNTPLHMAAAVPSTVSLERQKEICWLLIQAGGQTNMQNRQGKTPLALVSTERKEVIRKIFYKKS